MKLTKEQFEYIKRTVKQLVLAERGHECEYNNATFHAVIEYMEEQARDMLNGE